MKQLLDIECADARVHLLKGSSYFNGDFPAYISFEPILQDVAAILNGDSYTSHGSKPSDFSGVNYQIIANKDGRFAWRPFELMHPAIYVSLVNTITEPNNWKHVKTRFSEFKSGVVECCSLPVLQDENQSDKANQITNWWKKIEQKSLIYSLEYNHLLHTDVVDCYGSIYTHSIPWALHGLEVAKAEKGNAKLLGNKIDSHIQASRYGQTNGICQGSVLMDLIAEIVLGYVDELITKELDGVKDFKILRYRDDYRIFANNDELAEQVLKVVSDKLRIVGMKLGQSKTTMNSNVVEGAVKPDKLAGIMLEDFGTTNASTIQKQLLRLHAFGKRFPSSGALRVLLEGMYRKVSKLTKVSDDLEVQIAIAVDIAVISPNAFPAIAGILSHFIKHAAVEDKAGLWSKVNTKMSQVPNNGYLQIWMQRVTKPKSVGIEFVSNEAICKIVNGEEVPLWENKWITSSKLKAALKVSKIIVKPALDSPEAIMPQEIELFKQNALGHSL